MKNKTAAAFLDLDIVGQVHRATPKARELVITGIGELENADTPDFEGIVTYVQAFVGHEGPDCPDEEIEKYEEGLKAAYALGIAVGQLLQPGFFKGGAR